MVWWWKEYVVFCLVAGSALGMIYSVYALTYRLVLGKGKKRPLAVALIFVCLWLLAAYVILLNFLPFGSKVVESEAHSNLGAIFTTQVSYFGEVNANRDPFTLLNWPAEVDTANSTCGDGSGLDLNCFIEKDPTAHPAPRGNR